MDEEKIFVRSLRPEHLRRIWKVAGAGLVVIVAGFAALIADRPERLARMDWTDWAEFALMFVVLVVVPLEAQTQSTLRLTINDRGMTFRGSLPRILRWFDPWMSWSVEWGQIKKVEVMKYFGIVRLLVPKRALPIKLHLWGWIPASQEPNSALELHGRRHKDLESSPIWRALLANGVVHRQQGGGSVVDFDLIGHPASRAALITCAMLAGTGLTALMTESETYIADGYGFLIPHGVAGIAGLLLFWINLSRTRVPTRLPAGIPVGLSLVGGMAAAMFSYGGLVLANRVVAPAIPVVYQVSAPCTTLEPDNPKFPRIIWSTGFSDYWCQFKKGTEFAIPVRTGLFGTYQFDQGAYVEQIRAYRRAKESK